MSAMPVRPRAGLSLVQVRDVKVAPVVRKDGKSWRFVGVDGRHHFWSADGVECLWCASRRGSAEIKAWFAAGKPAELCE